jgi:hypothetical protein
MGLISSLGNKDIRERHLEDIFKVLGVPFTKNFSL